jgi:hypothetical protein
MLRNNYERIFYDSNLKLAINAYIFFSNIRAKGPGCVLGFKEHDVRVSTRRN